MGGDGGTKASNRRFMRGAGTADHTADSKRASPSELAEAERDRLKQAMTTCAVSGNPLDFKPGASTPGVSRGDVVACPYGRLYAREAAVEALLRRREQEQQSGEEPEIGWHVRGLKDLHPVRFQVAETAGEAADGGSNGKGSAVMRYTPTCPITGLELLGSVPAVLVVRKKVKKKSKNAHKSITASGGDSEQDVQPNVLSERAIKEMGIPSLQEEYGPFEEDHIIRLAPPLAGGVFDVIKAELERRREGERASKKSKKSDKKRKNGGNGVKLDEANGEKKRHTQSTAVVTGRKPKPSGGEGSAAQTARSNVAAAVASNPVLSSLFSNGTKVKVSEKQKKDNLFTLNG